jgi:hypothetical protein
VVWGGLHGIYMIVSVLTENSRNRVWARIGGPARLRRWLAMFVTFHLVTFSWIFFRADDIGAAFTLIGNLFDLSRFQLLVGSFGMYEMLLATGGIVVLEVVHFIERGQNFRVWLDRLPALIRWTIYYAVTMSILLFGVINQKQAFIYFQF